MCIKNGPRRVAGLTLVEMMITVAVLALLATVAYPIFTNQVQKARRAEAKTALEAIVQAQERFFSVNGRYSNDIVNDFGSSPAVDRTLDISGCSGNSTCGTVGGYYTVTLNGNAIAFDLTAAPGGGQSGDKCGSFTLDHLGVRGDGNNTIDCW